MNKLSTKLNLSGNLIRDLGFKLDYPKFEIDIEELENELNDIRTKVINAKSNKEAHKHFKKVLSKFNVGCVGLFDSLDYVDLNAWVSGGFEMPNDITVYINYNTKTNSITSSNFQYIKTQIIQIYIHEVVHFCRYTIQAEKDIDKYESIEEGDLVKYLSQTEEMYAYAYQILFQHLTDNNRSAILTWYNKKIKEEKTLKKLVKIVNKVAKTPIFRDKKYQFYLK